MNAPTNPTAPTSPTSRLSYRVTAPLVQLMGQGPDDVPEGAVQRHFYQGQPLPDWVNEEDLAHLLSIGAIESIDSTSPTRTTTTTTTTNGSTR